MVLYKKVHEQESMRMRDQENLMEKLYYGHGDLISYLDMFLKGQGVFEGMVEGNSNNTRTKRLKSLYARSSKDYILGGNINREVMERVQLSKTEVVSGRYLRSCAADGACEARKSIPFLLKYLDEETGKPARSGDEIEDVVTKWLDDFYVYCESGNVTSPVKMPLSDELASSDDEVDEGVPVLEAPAVLNDSNTSDQVAPSTPKKVSTDNGDVIITIPHRHHDWFFPGFMFVLLFGPFAENREAKRTMDFFLNRDPAVSTSDKKAYGRTKMREQKYQGTDFQMMSDKGPSTNKRTPSMSVSEELRLASLEYKQASLQMQQNLTSLQYYETRIMAKKVELDGIKSLLEAASQMARVTNDWATWKRLFEQYEKAQEELRQVNVEHDAQKNPFQDVRIPSLVGLKGPPEDDECPVEEINTMQLSSSTTTSQLSSPVARSKISRSTKANNN